MKMTLEGTQEEIAQVLMAIQAAERTRQTVQFTPERRDDVKLEVVEDPWAWRAMIVGRDDLPPVAMAVTRDAVENRALEYKDDMAQDGKHVRVSIQRRVDDELWKEVTTL